MRKLLALAICVLLAPSGAAVAADASGGPVTPLGVPAAQLSGFGCVRAVAPAMRTVTVTGVMRPVAGTQRMRMRFDLLASLQRRGHYHPVHGPNLGEWLAPGVPTLGSHPDDVWRVPHPVSGLDTPSFYKLRVSFRWIGQSGHVIARQVLVTQVCHQPELRPNLAAQSLSVSPAATAGKDDYVGVLGNLGATGAGPFDVQLSLADGTTITHQILWLGPHRTRQVSFVAGSCSPGSTVTLSVDPSGTVDDYDRANNTVSVACSGG